jgi:hypothetical protein
MTGSSSEGLRSIRSQAAHDGRAASQRIDRVEAQQRWALEVVAEALGPDALRVKLGQERALAFLVAAGWDAHKVDQTRDRWEVDRRERERSVSQQTMRSYSGNGFEGDPRHDERITEAVMRGASNEELRQIMRQVGAEYRQEATRKASEAQRSRDVLWTGRDGRPVLASAPAPLGVSSDPRTGNPRQRSVVRRSVPEPGSEPVGETPMGDVRPVATVCTAHVARAGDKFCPVCGKPRPQPRPEPQEEAAS